MGNSRRPPRIGKKALLKMKRRRERILRFQELADAGSEEDNPVQMYISKAEDGAPSSSRKRILYRSPVSHKGRKHNHAEVIDLTGDNDTVMTNSREKREITTNTTPFSEKCTYLRPLSVRDRMLVKTAFRREVGDTIVYLQDSNITIRGESFRRLRGDNWLDDNVINGFMGMLNARNKYMNSTARAVRAKSAKSHPNTYAFSSFFFTTISRRDDGFQKAARWTDRAGIDVGLYDLLIFPLHIGNNHWAICTINLVDEEISYLDPLNERDCIGTTKCFQNWLIMELRRKKGVSFAEKLGVHKWRHRTNRYRVNAAKPGSAIKSIPLQNDSSSCGVFALKFADCLSRGISIFFDQRHIGLLREKIALDIIRKYIPL